MKLFDRIFKLEEINGANRCPTYLYRWTLLNPSTASWGCPGNTFLIIYLLPVSLLLVRITIHTPELSIGCMGYPGRYRRGVLTAFAANYELSLKALSPGAIEYRLLNLPHTDTHL